MSVYLKNYKSFQPCSVTTAAELTHESESEIQDLVVDFLRQNSGTDFDFLAVSPNHEIMFSTPLGVFIWVGDDDYEILENSNAVRKYLLSRQRQITGFYAEEVKKALVTIGVDLSSVTQRRVEKKEKIILKVHYRVVYELLTMLEQRGILDKSQSLDFRLDFVKQKLKSAVQKVADKYSIDIRQYYGEEVGWDWGERSQSLYIEVPIKSL